MVVTPDHLRDLFLETSKDNKAKKMYQKTTIDLRNQCEKESESLHQMQDRK